MADVAALRRLALALPEVTDESDGERLALKIGGKGLAWSYLARSSPKARRMPQPGCVAVRCDLARKEMLVEAAPDRFFDDEHYRGYPALLVRLEAIDETELDALLNAAWRMQAPRSLQKRHAAEMAESAPSAP